MEGKTIATCLAGNAPDNLLPADSVSSADVVENLEEFNVIAMENRDIVSRTVYPVYNYLNAGGSPQVFKFDYNLFDSLGNALSAQGFDKCKGCKSNVSFKIIQPDGCLCPLEYTIDNTGSKSDTLIFFAIKDDNRNGCQDS